jgi:hypothetical protein
MKKPTMNHASATLLRSLSGAQHVPEDGAPAPPEGFIPSPKATKLRRKRPTQSQRAAAEKAAAELRGSSSFTALFGQHFVTAEALADALTECAGWNRHQDAAKSWHDYANDEASIAWDATLAVLDRVSEPFATFAAASPTLANELPTFAALLSGRSASAKRGVATRRKRKEDAAAHQGTTSTPAAPSSAPATTPGAPATGSARSGP